MKRPVGMMVACYTAGVFLAATFKSGLFLCLGALGGCFIFALLLRKYGLYGWLALIAALGLANFSWRTFPTSPDDLRLVVGTNEVIAVVRGSLVETPREKIIVHSHYTAIYTIARIKVRQVSLEKGKWVPATGELVATTRGVLDTNFFRGQSVVVGGVINPPSGPLAEGLFDYRHYLSAHGVYYELKTELPDDWGLCDPIRKQLPLSDRFLQWSKHTMAYGLPGEDEPLHLLWAMTLGWRTAFTDDISEPFLRAGTMHLFAIDGLRIALVSGIIITLLRTVGLSRAWSGAVIIPLIWFYTGATGWGAPAIRASIMMTIVIGGWAMSRPSDLLNSLAVGALTILLWDPRQLFDAGFQLSFLVVMVIAVMLPKLRVWIDQRLQYDPLLPRQLLSARQLRLQSWARSLANFTALSFTAWVASLPLAAKYFHLVSPISTLANLVAVPLGTLALTANLAALVCGGWFPWATTCFNEAAWFFMSAMTWVSQACSQLPAAYYYVPEPSWWLITIFYAFILIAFSGWLTNRRRWGWFIGISLLAAAVPAWQGVETWRTTKLTVIPLAGGHSCVLDAPGRTHDWVIDCGSEDSGKSILTPFLRAHGFNRLSRLALTEGEERNYGGAEKLDGEFKIKELWTSHAKFRSAEYRDEVEAFEKSPSRHHFFEVGTNLDCWQQLYPAADDKFPKADDEAMVLRGNIRGTKILLLSDLGRSGQSALLNESTNLSADIVVSGIPDGSEPLCDELIKASEPKVIIITDSEFPANLRANAMLHQRLESHGVPVIYTRRAGAVTILIDNGGWKIRAMDGEVQNSRSRGPQSLAGRQ